MAWWLLPVAILLMGCPGPEDRKKLETVSSFEGFIDRFMSAISPDQSTGQGFLLSEEGGESGTAWNLSLLDYMVRPLAQPADSWLAEIRFTLVKSGEECSPTQQPVEVYIDFLGDGVQWAPYSAASRISPDKNVPNKEVWRVWKPDSEDWHYLVGITSPLAPGQTPQGVDETGLEASQ